MDVCGGFLEGSKNLHFQKNYSKSKFLVFKKSVENCQKNHKIFVQKTIDISFFGRYNRGSF